MSQLEPTRSLRHFGRLFATPTLAHAQTFDRCVTGHIGVHGRVDVRTYVCTYVLTADDVMAIKLRFLASMGYHIFLTMGLRARARSSAIINICPFNTLLLSGLLQSELLFSSFETFRSNNFLLPIFKTPKCLVPILLTWLSSWKSVCSK